MIKHHCDRCGKEIESQVYYITITSDSLTSLNGYDERQTLESASRNFAAHFSIPKIYCQRCCNEIEKFMIKDGKQPTTDKGVLKMYKCCGHIFDSDALVKEFNSYGLGDGSGETFLVCPICGESPEEAYQCRDCGEWFTAEELTEGFCDNCIEEIVHQYRYDIDKCVSVCGDETQEIRISSFLASMFNEDQIEQILINELRDSQKIDCLPFITDDLGWFLERVKGVR